MLRDEIVKSLSDIETCLTIAEIESKSWHDFWVVQRALCRAMWNVLTWIVRIEDTRNRPDPVQNSTINSKVEPIQTVSVKSKIEPIRNKTNRRD